MKQAWVNHKSSCYNVTILIQEQEVIPDKALVLEYKRDSLLD